MQPTAMRLLGAVAPRTVAGRTYTALAAAAAVRADVALPGIFGDGMVVQRDAKLPVWGTAAAGEKVQVAFAKQTKTATADAEGCWSLMLDPVPAGGPHTMTVTGKNTIELKNVLVGEVWLCSGQSNMAMTVGAVLNAQQEIAAAELPKIRHFRVAPAPTPEPQDQCRGAWSVCSPATARGFSATAFFFARALHKHLGVPIGLINASIGGTPIEAWTPHEALEAEPALKPILEPWDEKAKASIYDQNSFDVAGAAAAAEAASDPVGSAAAAQSAAEAASDPVGSAAAAQSAAEATAANASNLSSGTVDGDRLPAMSQTKKGAVPLTGVPSGLFLKDDGTFAAAGGGGGDDLPLIRRETNNLVKIGTEHRLMYNRDRRCLSVGGSAVILQDTFHKAWAWGVNGTGQLGDNTTADKSSPIQVLGQSDFVAVSAGDSHCYGLKADGTAWAWGQNNSGGLGEDPIGQLGDNTTVHKSSPVQVVRRFF